MRRVDSVTISCIDFGAWYTSELTSEIVRVFGEYSFYPISVSIFFCQVRMSVPKRPSLYKWFEGTAISRMYEHGYMYDMS